MKTGKPSDDRDLEAKLRKNVEDVLTKVGEKTANVAGEFSFARALLLLQIENVFLEGGTKKYIVGGDKMSVADLFACCELEQPLMAG